MSIKADKNRLTQAHNITKMKRVHKLNEMLTVYQENEDNEEHSKQYIYCALIPIFSNSEFAC